MNENREIHRPTTYTNTSTVIAYIIMETTTTYDQIVIGNILMTIGQILVANTAIPVLTNSHNNNNNNQNSNNNSTNNNSNNNLTT